MSHEHGRRLVAETDERLATLSADEGCTVVRVEHDTGLPPADASVIDIALLDMHHGWPNLGHDSLVHLVRGIARDLQPALTQAGLSFRVLSYDVRRAHRVPQRPGGRHAIYIGTGGPGHLDPHMNDGIAPGSQGIREDPAWEPHVFELFDRIRDDRDAVLIGVCHTFGVMCRWLGIGDTVLRGREKGGKSSGVVENILTPEAVAHPWFSGLSREIRDRRRFRVLDSRLYDVIPTRPLDGIATPMAYETVRAGGPAGPALTMIEVVRDRNGVMPRILGVNHHPEIVNRPWQLDLLRRRMKRGDVTPEWYAERAASLSEQIDDRGDESLEITSRYTLLGPLRHALRCEAERRGLGAPA